jgi:4-hydroxy 2-oxovalerate aldolase
MSIRDISTPQILDVTLRDGGYVNRHSWSLEEALHVVRACVLGGVPGVEIGYYRPGRHKLDGESQPAASCPHSYVERLRAETPKDMTLAVMAHQQDVGLEHYRELASLGVGLVRLPTKISGIDQVAGHVRAIQDAGMRAAVNLIRVSEVGLRDIARAAAVVEAAGADRFYMVDSNGSLFPEEVTEIIGVVRRATDLPLGFHAHDGLSLAFSNSLAAVNAGCEHLDASLAGMGKGGGNLSMELITGYFRSRENAPFFLTPLARATAEVLAPWRGGGSLARCDSIVSSLLDLNLDDIARVQTDADLLPLLDPTNQATRPQLVLP